MKKIISVIMCFCILNLFAVTANAADDIKITLNGDEIQSDVEPFAANKTMMLPVRAVFEAMGAQVNWDDDNKTVLMVYKEGEDFTSIVLQIGLEYAFRNSEYVNLETPAEIVDNRTFVPLSFFNEVLNEQISWDEANKTVVITTDRD